MTKKHASPTIRALHDRLANIEGMTSEKLQALWLHIFNDERKEAAAIISELVTDSRFKESIFLLVAADAIEMADEKLFDIKPKGK